MSADVAGSHHPFGSDILRSTMNRLCRQVSIESPGPTMRDCVFNLIVPVPDTPPQGARIKIVCAGACYRRHRSSSISSISSVSSELSDYNVPTATSQQQQQQQQNSPAHQGIRDGAIFPGFEVAGVIESLGSELGENCEFQVGQRVIIYPFDDVPNGYAELICVPELKYLIPIPDNLPISVAAMLPTGALLAMSATLQAHRLVTGLLKERGDNSICKILIVGTGGLALWAVRIASYHFYNSECRDRVEITVASLRDENFMLAKEIENVNIVQWNEDLYEKQLIERTKDACNGPVDIVIDFGTTSRSLHRSMQCLTKGGLVLVSEEVAEKLLPKFARLAEGLEQKIQPVSNGSIEQLHELVKLVSAGEIKPLPHSVFPCEQASEVVRNLCASKIPGRAILRFHDID